MMDKLGYSPYQVIFYVGFIFLCAGTASVLAVCIGAKYFYDNYGYKVESFEEYFTKNSYKDIIIHIS